jgi:hypothetical protein
VLSLEDVVGALQRLAEVLQTQRTLEAALAGIAEAAVLTVPGCDAASVALSVEGRPATVAATARVALELDLVRYDSDDGPCLTSSRTMESLRLMPSSPATPSRTSRSPPGDGDARRPLRSLGLAAPALIRPPRGPGPPVASPCSKGAAGNA